MITTDNIERFLSGIHNTGWNEEIKTSPSQLHTRSRKDELRRQHLADLREEERQDKRNLEKIQKELRNKFK